MTQVRVKGYFRNISEGSRIFPVIVAHSLTLSLGYTARWPSEQGKYDEADHFYLGAIEIGKKALGDDHLSVADHLISRAGLLMAQVRIEIIFQGGSWPILQYLNTVGQCSS